MNWPWVSRRSYDLLREWLDDDHKTHERSWRSVFGQNEQFLAMYIKAVQERDKLRADANALKGRLAAHGDKSHELYGPYFEALK